ncbi:hypothetical protein N7533_007653 [Penicillium manginii]|uniref:uncharacterized protein n=1 Tax=Penicillium manginii TaxID=203109 RepID=UPI002546E640|nr:uncharacterized protein N7533_007653 [Penicillium manginii]KAJ5750625.1 hypothetical protein N7533_007653 [Penicillium manginii]
MQLALSAQLLAGLVAPFALALSPRTEIADSYDFVVIGGGQAGLVLGGRLAEDTNHTVLVLESGGNGDEYRNRIDTPAYSYFDSLWTTPLNWGFYTVEQPNANDREIYWPRGKVLGGSSAINGLYMTRPGENEINAWQSMLGDMDGAENWSWDSFYSAMKKSETFSPPTDAVEKQADITWNSSTHGSDGPIHASYPGFTFDQVGQWSEACANIGIPISADMYGGSNWGAEVSTSCINPSNWTRSYSRTGYLDPLPDRGNYDVLANAHVTRIIFDSTSNLTANAVEYTPNNGTTKKTINVTKEVILAAGSVGSPAVLLHSGVGPKDVLSSAGVDLVHELPGVGQHLQDHLSATIKWTTDVETAGSVFYDNGSERNNPLFLTYIDSAIAYVNASNIYPTTLESELSTIQSKLTTYAPNTTYENTVLEGYKAIYNTTAQIFNSPTGLVELLFMNSDGNGDVGITAALQHPYSHGRIYINSSNPMDYPVIDPNYLSNPSDTSILTTALKLARRLGNTTPLSSNLTAETSPGSSTQSDSDWETWIRTNAGTEYHPSSSCAMLPLSQGGVVDANLRVHGLANVRVIDASVPPIALSTHLMASTYGVAEIGAAVVREFWDGGVQGGIAFSGGSLTNSSSSSRSSASASASASGTVEKNGAGGGMAWVRGPSWFWGVSLMLGAGVVFV